MKIGGKIILGASALLLLAGGGMYRKNIKDNESLLQKNKDFIVSDFKIPLSELDARFKGSWNIFNLNKTITQITKYEDSLANEYNKKEAQKDFEAFNRIANRIIEREETTKKQNFIKLKEIFPGRSQKQIDSLVNIILEMKNNENLVKTLF